MQTFDDAVSLVLSDKIEGADTNDPNDPGGLTRFGIAQNYHPDVDVANLTKNGALSIYRTEYWGRAGCDRMPWPWALGVFDDAVNHGTISAVVRAQKALRVRQDGAAGPTTLMAMKLPDWRDRLADFYALRCVAYAQDKNAAQFERGWFARCFLVYAVGLVT